MAFLDDLIGSQSGNGGLMGMMANPQTAGMLGMAQGLLSASAPSRLPVRMGPALGMGLQGMQQGIGSGVQMQQNLLRMQALQGLANMPGNQGQQAPTSLLGVPSMPEGGLLSPTLPQTAPQGGATASSPQYGFQAQIAQPQQASASLIYGKTPQQLFQQGMLMNIAGMQGGGEMMKIAVEHDPTLAAMMPTDITKMGVQAGMSPQEIQAANRGGLEKAKYIAPVNARPGSILRDPITMQPMAFNPNIPQGGTPLFDASGNVVSINTIPGAAGVTREMSAAQQGGKAQYELQQVWDPNANGGRGGYVQQSVANVANAAGGGGTPMGGLPGIFAQQESSGGRAAPDNPLQIQQGTFNQYAQKGESWSNPSDRTAVAQRVLANYNQKYSGDIGRIATAYFSGEGNVAPAGSPTPFLKNVTDKNGKSVASYVGDMYGRASGMTPAPQGGPMASQPPLGQTSMSNEAQVASAKVMADDYQNMQGVRQNAPAVLQAYDHLLDLAKTGGFTGWAANGGLTGKLMSTEAATYASPEAAEYDKTRAFLINAGGASLGAHNTDAARANLDRMIPEFGKPTQAKIDGIQQARNQTAMSALRADLLTPLFQSGDSKAYTSAANQFDTVIKPEMMPTLTGLLSMPAGPERTAALRQAISNPQMKSALDFMVQSGKLK